MIWLSCSFVDIVFVKHSHLCKDVCANSGLLIKRSRAIFPPVAGLSVFLLVVGSTGLHVPHCYWFHHAGLQLSQFLLYHWMCVTGCCSALSEQPWCNKEVFQVGALFPSLLDKSTSVSVAYSHNAVLFIHKKHFYLKLHWSIVFILTVERWLCYVKGVAQW